MNALVAVLAAALGVIVAILAGPWRRQRRRRRLLAAPTPPARQALLERTRAWRRLPAGLRPRWAARVNVFLDEQSFVGCGGLEVDEGMRLEIASQACLLRLGQDVAYDELRAILVYPGPFVVPQRDEEDGIVTEYEQEVSGEAWDTSKVILAWRDVADADETCNPVLHEFAHHLDHAEGVLRAHPALLAASALLRARVEAGADSPVDPDALRDPAEFVAYATEAFFEVPRALASFHAPLYGALAQYYGVDPASW